MDDDTKPPEKLTDADVHLILNVSTNELPDVRSYSDTVRPNPLQIDPYHSSNRILTDSSTWYLHLLAVTHLRCAPASAPPPH